MKTNLRIWVVAALPLTLCLALAPGLLIGPRNAAAGAEPEPAVDSPDQYLWRLVYRIETKPGGETVAVPRSKPHQIKVLYTFVTEFRVRADGTFAFEDCDFGHCLQEDLQEVGEVKIHSRVNWQGLLRGSGKWQPASRDADETLTLNLEWGAGNGASETKTDGDDYTYVGKYAVSPDRRTVTSTSEPPGGKPIIYSYPNSFVASEWTLKPNNAAPDGNRGVIRGRGLKVIPVSFLAAKEDPCEDKQDFSGARFTTLICEGGAKTPVRESVEIEKAKQEADLAVFFSGGEESFPRPGSSGTVSAIVSNNGPCTANAKLNIYVLAGRTLGADYPGSNVRIVSHTPGTSELTVHETAGTQETDSYMFAYQFELPPGGARLVKVEGQDTTPAGQSAKYMIRFIAHVNGDITDPNAGNNSAHRSVTFNPPKKTPPKPTPSKPK